MNRHALNVSAVFVKDLRQLGPLAAISAAIILARTLFDYSSPNLANWLTNATLLVPGIFIITLVQQDAPASARHEWLTRPIGSPDVLTAKILLAAAAILFPAVAGSIVSGIRHGAAVQDTLLQAITGMKTQMNLIGAFVLLFVAAVTPTLGQAIGVLAGLVLFQMLAQPLPNHIARAGTLSRSSYSSVALSCCGSSMHSAAQLLPESPSVRRLPSSRWRWRCLSVPLEMHTPNDPCIIGAS